MTTKLFYEWNLLQLFDIKISHIQQNLKGKTLITFFQKIKKLSKTSTFTHHKLFNRKIKILSHITLKTTTFNLL